MKACNFQTGAKFSKYLCPASEETILHILLSDVKRQMDSMYRLAISGWHLMRNLQLSKGGEMLNAKCFSPDKMAHPKKS